MRELLSLFRRITTSQSTSYCVLCLCTGTKRKVTENNSLNSVLAALNDEEVWPWKHAEDKKMRVCYVCEARLVSTLKVIELIRTGVMAEKLLQCYKKNQLNGVCSKVNKHPLKPTMAACSERYRAAATISTLFLTQAISINIRDEAAAKPRTESKLSAAPLNKPDSQSPSRLPQTATALQNKPNTNTEVCRVLPTAKPATENYAVPLPTNVQQTIKLTDTLTITNSGKYLALKTHGEDVILHGIFQGTDGKSYVPTLSVMIVAGQLLPMPDFGLKKCSEGHTLPGMGFSLPGLEKILTGEPEENETRKNTNTNASIQDNLPVKQLGLQSPPKIVPKPLVSSNDAIRPNLKQYKNNTLTPKLGFGSISQFNAGFRSFNAISERGSKLPRVDAVPNPDIGLPHVDATPNLCYDLTEFEEKEGDLPNENLIDVVEQTAASMEEDPLNVQHAELEAMPFPISIKTEFDTEPVSVSNPKPDMSILRTMLNADMKPLTFQGLQPVNELSNVEKAILRLDIINKYKKPIVPLIPVQLNKNERINLKTNKVSIVRSTLKNESKSLLLINYTLENKASTKARNTPPKAASKLQSERKNNKNNVRIKPAEFCKIPARTMAKPEQDVTVLVSDSESEGEGNPRPIHNVVKTPIMKDGYSMDWEDKIPMDVITYMDATAPPSPPTTDGSALGVIVDAYSERDSTYIHFDD